MQYRVVFTDPQQHTFDLHLVAALNAASAELDVVADRSANNLARVCRTADAVITSSAQISAPVIDQMQKCRIIARVGTGYDNVDCRAAAARGIPVTNVPNFCTEEVANHTMALLLALYRKITVVDREVRTGDWNPDRVLPADRLSTRTLGLVGYGAIAQAVAARAASFGMQIVYFDPFVTAEAAKPGYDRSDSLGDVLRRADYVSLHVPLTEQTVGLMGSDEFATMKPTAVLINTSRGRVVDELALIQALERGTIAGAGLDVLEHEPPSADNPLLGMPNVVLTPHCASHSIDSLQEVRRRVIEEVVRALRGEPLVHVVNQVGRRTDA